MNHNTSISATKISAFLNNFSLNGLSIDEVIRYAGVNSLILSSPDNRLSGFDAHKIIEAAVKLTNDDNLGLHQGESLSKGFSNILGYIMMNCSTIMECWTKYIRYEKIIDSTSTSTFNIVGKNAMLSSITLDKYLKANRHFSDFKIAGMLSYIKLLCGHDFKIKEVHFSHSSPKDTSEYQRIFKCKVYFKKPKDALLFNSEQLQIPVIEPNKKLLLLFERNAQEILETMHSHKNYTNVVTEIILEEMMKCNSPSINTIANKLSLSVRNLQLHLQNENTSYTSLIKEVRKHMAEKYLTDRNVSIDEIAYYLGFSEASAFHRAFKSWTGLTPVQFRVRR
jgi:AraC-like DNA-binding protein